MRCSDWEQRWDRSLIVLRLEDLAQVEVQALNGVLENQKTSGCIVVVLIVIEIISGLSTTRRSKLDFPVFCF
ncbi:hypothetical protein WB44_00105 [Synechococcus sp. WH 8020]|uniref:hypothetical protein n=1 Tax=Synechococcus sp. (strain WH8020) TaxID=32052 RepID=UPI00065282BA|nr:hypothetical protein [Synechococcus sp. WH 8020]AKN59788.1 hypothetical protein WB44_00105 [Synechococcus sp. WH 8020]